MSPRTHWGCRHPSRQSASKPEMKQKGKTKTPRIRSVAVKERKNDLLKLLKPFVLKTTAMIRRLETMVNIITARTSTLEGDRRGENNEEEDEGEDEDEDGSIEEVRSWSASRDIMKIGEQLRTFVPLMCVFFSPLNVFSDFGQSQSRWRSVFRMIYEQQMWCQSRLLDERIVSIKIVGWKDSFDQDC